MGDIPASISPAAAPTALNPWRVNFEWLIRLRFGAVLGQLVVIATVHWGLHVRLRLVALGVVVALELLLNSWALDRARQKSAVGPKHVTLSVSADLLLFSVLLFLSGGPANPFSFLYLIHIALAALILSPRAAYALVAAALSCSLALFWLHLPLPHDHSHHMQEYDWHMRGMWVAFGLAACFIVYFIQRMARALRSIERELNRSRERAARSDAVAGLAMLAAGAAHELASPLSTIAVASGELMHRLPGGPHAAALHEDLLLIRAQVERCREILDQLAVDAGQARASTFQDLPWDAIVEQSLLGLNAGRLQIEAPPRGPVPSLKGSLVATSRALRNLVRNALDASSPGTPVRIVVTEEADGLAFEVRDEGTGMANSVLARAREPFFTTKPRGQGMGLGLFLAESVAEQMGGRLEIASTPGAGTRAKLVFPLPATNRRSVPVVAPAQTLVAHA